MFEASSSALAPPPADHALRASEARYRALFNYAPDGILVADHQSRYIDANPSICRMLGYTRDELIGLNAADIVAPAEVAHIGSALTQIIEASDSRREWQFRRKDGSMFSADVIATMTPDGNLLAMVRDVTDRNLADAAQRQTEERMRFALQTERNTLESQFQQAQKMEAVGRLAGGVAHDFNNLLTVILGFCELLLAGVDEDDSRTFEITEIHKAATRAAELTTQLLAFSAAPPASAAGQETILVVEDSDALRELTRRLLLTLGYTVLIAGNADDAVRLFEENPAIDVLLTDVVMPGPSGPDLSQRLGELRPGLKVIYMSGYTDEAIVEHGVLQAGIAFLHKPFTSVALGRKIREALDA